MTAVAAVATAGKWVSLSFSVEWKEVIWSGRTSDTVEIFVSLNLSYMCSITRPLVNHRVVLEVKAVALPLKVMGVFLCEQYYIDRSQWRNQVRGPGGRPPLIFRPNWGPKARKNLFKTAPPPFPRFWVTAPPTPVNSQLQSIFPRLVKCVWVLKTQWRRNMTWNRKTQISFVSLVCVTWTNGLLIIEAFKVNNKGKLSETGYKGTRLCF